MIDTTEVFPEYKGCRQSLKSLIREYLRKRIQTHGEKGHDQLRGLTRVDNMANEKSFFFFQGKVYDAT